MLYLKLTERQFSTMYAALQFYINMQQHIAHRRLRDNDEVASSYVGMSDDEEEDDERKPLAALSSRDVIILAEQLQQRDSDVVYAEAVVEEEAYKPSKGAVGDKQWCERVLERLARVEQALEDDEGGEELVSINQRFNNALKGVADHDRQLEYLTNRVKNLEDSVDAPNMRAGKQKRKPPKK